MLIARVAVAAATYAIDRPYAYFVTPEQAGQVRKGMRVLVPFGRGDRPSEGLILALGEEEPDAACKPITQLLERSPILDPWALRLVLWLRERYFCTVFDAARTMIPTGLWFTLTEVYELAPGIGRDEAERRLAHAPAAKLVLELLYVCGGRAEMKQIRSLLVQLKDPRGPVRTLMRAGVVVRRTVARRRIGDKREQRAVLAMDPERALALVTPKRRTAPMRYAVTELLCAMRSVSVKELTYFTGASRTTLKSLAHSGILTFEEEAVYRRALPAVPQGETRPLAALDEAQEGAFRGLADLLDRHTAQAALLYGVTGSGKTQVYLHLIRRTLDQGRGAIVLVPEISLTPSLLRLFLSHFGGEVAVLHSYLPAGERCDEWRRIRAGRARVVVGTRSAVFAPVPDLGLIVLDEEQEGSYQSESMVRDHARDVAKFRCTQSRALLLLGSATPCVESRYAAEIGQYHLFTLTRRFNARALPAVMIADMREELRAGNASGLSQRLRDELAENLRRGEQSILFLNRRGNSRMAVCSSCGDVPHCPRCSVHLTYHSANGRLMCHYCGWSEPLPGACPACGGRFQFVGIGTQRLEEEVKALWPDIEVMRMDADTVSANGAHEALLDRFRQKRVPILLGTQMVAKGLDFEDVTLVGAIDADLSLYADSYRAAERTFSLIAQVVGRAGRGGKPGRAVVQTWSPDDDVITLAARQDYDAFYESEKQVRQLLQFPPFTDLYRLTVSGPEEAEVVRACTVLCRSLEPWLEAQRRAGGEGEVLGPAPAPVVRVNDRYRYRLLVKCRASKQVRALLAQLLRTAQLDPANRRLSLWLDVDPMD